MTDKQIIIDGVDVRGCNFTLERDGKIKCECCHATGFGVICDCESWKTCDYKNYKRKEQECEELKKIIDEAKNSKLDLKSFLVGEAVQNEYEQQLDQLKAENEILRQYKASKQASYESMQKEWNNAVLENRELHKTLTEIKEIVEQGVKIHDDIIVSNQILQKISEVEDANRK